MSRLISGIIGKVCIYKTFNLNEKEEFYNIVYDKLKQTYPSIVNEKHYKKLSKNGEVYLAKFYKDYNGLCMFLSKDIILAKSLGRTWFSKTGLHESIHKICGEKWYKYRKGIAEGMCEDVAQECINKKVSSIFYFTRINKYKMQYNFGYGTSYVNPVCLVRQMKKLLNDPLIVAESKLNGNLNFDNEFIKQFGIPLYAFMNVMTTKCINMKNFKIFLKTQDVLLKKAFNIKYDKCSQEEEYINFLKELREFETYRARVSYVSTDEKYKDYYVQYYNEKYNEIKLIFDERNYNHKKLDDYKYEQQEFYKEDKLRAHSTYEKVAEKIEEMGISPKDINNIKTFDMFFVQNGEKFFASTNIVNDKYLIPNMKDKLKLNIENENICIDDGEIKLTIDKDRNAQLQDKDGNDLEIKSFDFEEIPEKDVINYEELYGIDNQKIERKLPYNMEKAIIYMCGQLIKEFGMNIKNILNRNKKLIGGKEIKKLNAPQEPKTMEEKYRVDICDGELSVNNQSLNSEQKKYSRNDDKENEK